MSSTLDPTPTGCSPAALHPNNAATDPTIEGSTTSSTIESTVLLDPTPVAGVEGIMNFSSAASTSASGAGQQYVAVAPGGISVKMPRCIPSLAGGEGRPVTVTELNQLIVDSLPPAAIASIPSPYASCDLEDHADPNAPAPAIDPKGTKAQHQQMLLQLLFAASAQGINVNELIAQIDQRKREATAQQAVQAPLSVGKERHGTSGEGDDDVLSDMGDFANFTESSTQHVNDENRVRAASISVSFGADGSGRDGMALPAMGASSGGGTDTCLAVAPLASFSPSGAYQGMGSVTLGSMQNNDSFSQTSLQNSNPHLRSGPLSQTNVTFVSNPQTYSANVGEMFSSNQVGMSMNSMMVQGATSIASFPVHAHGGLHHIPDHYQAHFSASHQFTPAGYGRQNGLVAANGENDMSFSGLMGVSNGGLPTEAQHQRTASPSHSSQHQQQTMTLPIQPPLPAPSPPLANNQSQALVSSLLHQQRDCINVLSKDRTSLLIIPRPLIDPTEGSAAYDAQVNSHDTHHFAFKFRLCKLYEEGCPQGASCVFIHSCHMLDGVANPNGTLPPSRIQRGLGHLQVVENDVHFNAAVTGRVIEHPTLPPGRVIDVKVGRPGSGRNGQAQQSSMVSVPSEQVLLTKASRAYFYNELNAPKIPQACSHFERACCARGSACGFIHRLMLPQQSNASAQSQQAPPQQQQYAPANTQGPQGGLFEELNSSSTNSSALQRSMHSGTSHPPQQVAPFPQAGDRGHFFNNQGPTQHSQQHLSPGYSHHQQQHGHQPQRSAQPEYQYQPQFAPNVGYPMSFPAQFQRHGGPSPFPPMQQPSFPHHLQQQHHPQFAQPQFNQYYQPQSNPYPMHR